MWSRCGVDVKWMWMWSGCGVNVDVEWKCSECGVDVEWMWSGPTLKYYFAVIYCTSTLSDGNRVNGMQSTYNLLTYNVVYLRCNILSNARW